MQENIFRKQKKNLKYFEGYTILFPFSQMKILQNWLEHTYFLWNSRSGIFISKLKLSFKCKNCVLVTWMSSVAYVSKSDSYNK